MTIEHVHRWQASAELDRLNDVDYGRRLLSFDPGEEQIHPFDQAGAEQPLPAVTDRFQKRLARRVSSRSFGSGPLEVGHVAKLFAAANGVGPDGRPIVPSAGGLAPLHVYGLAFDVAQPLGGAIVRYRPETHAFAVVGATADVDADAILHLAGEQVPPLVLAFVIDPRSTLAKYGARGGRFLFQVVGHAAQNVGLRLAEERLAGYQLGGGRDRELLHLLGLGRAADDGAAWLGGLYACGRAA